MPRSNSRSRNNGGRNNNPSGRNQYSDWGVMDMARERPIAAAAAAAGAAAAGLFLWSRRAQISNQLSNLSDQLGEWTETMGSPSDWMSGDDTGGFASSGLSSGSTRSSGGSSGMGARGGTSETGGGNAVDLLAFHELDRQPVGVAAWHAVEQFDRLEEEVLAPLPMPEALEPRPPKDRPPRLQPLADALDRGPRAERKSAEVEVGEAEVGDQFAQVPRQDPHRIMLRLVRLGAEPVSAEVGHDHPEALRGDARCVAELDPVHVGVGEQAVEQDYRTALPTLMEGQLYAVRCGPMMDPRFAHPGKLPVAST